MFNWLTDMFSGPTVNIDGSPMVDGTGIDIHGHPYGVTDTHMHHNINDFQTLGDVVQTRLTTLLIQAAVVKLIITACLMTK